MRLCYLDQAVRTTQTRLLAYELIDSLRTASSLQRLRQSALHLRQSESSKHNGCVDGSITHWSTAGLSCAARASQSSELYHASYSLHRSGLHASWLISSDLGLRVQGPCAGVLNSQQQIISPWPVAVSLSSCDSHCFSLSMADPDQTTVSKWIITEDDHGSVLWSQVNTVEE